MIKALLLTLGLLGGMAQAENETVPRDKYYLEKHTMNAVVVREWTPLSNPNYSCVYIAYGNTGGLDCFKTEER